MSEILPSITQDEIANEKDDRRDEEIKGDRPPHYE